MQVPNSNHSPFQETDSPNVFLKHKVWLHPLLEAFRKHKPAEGVTWPVLAQPHLTDLLKLANDTAEHEQTLKVQTGLSTSAIQSILLTYLMQAKLKHETDPYQLLCMTPWVGVDTYKTHYRLLMRLFHPDRGLVNEAQAAHYAAKINWAYGQLKPSFERGAVASQSNNARQALQQIPSKPPLASKKVSGKKQSRQHHNIIYWLVSAGVTPKKIWLAIMVTFFVGLFAVYLYHQ